MTGMTACAVTRRTGPAASAQSARPAGRPVIGAFAPPPVAAPGPELRLVARLHVDLLRVSSAGCRRSR
jgi:hypothetical protein